MNGSWLAHVSRLNVNSKLEGLLGELGDAVTGGGEAVMYKIMSIRTNLIKASLLQMN